MEFFSKFAREINLYDGYPVNFQGRGKVEIFKEKYQRNNNKSKTEKLNNSRV